MVKGNHTLTYYVQNFKKGKLFQCNRTAAQRFKMQSDGHLHTNHAIIVPAKRGVWAFHSRTATVIDCRCPRQWAALGYSTPSSCLKQHHGSRRMHQAGLFGRYWTHDMFGKQQTQNLLEDLVFPNISSMTYKACYFSFLKRSLLYLERCK